MKEKKWARASTPNEARSLAVSSLPDKTTRLTVSGLQDFLIECFTARPSKFPVYLVTGTCIAPFDFLRSVLS